MLKVQLKKKLKKSPTRSNERLKNPPLRKFAD